MTGRTGRSLSALLLLITTTLSGCNVEDAIEALSEGGLKPSSRVTPASISQTSASGDSETISIASFNIQVLGVSKAGDAQVMDILADIVRRYDVVAVQELRAKDQTVIPRFVELINADGARYDSIVGPRLGRTSSKEQYVYLYNTARIEVDTRSIYTVEDPSDLLHRPPLVARFRVRGPPSEEAFTFTLVNIHTDPDETDIELDALADVFTAVQNNGSGEDDIILLGDLNVDDRHLGRLGELPQIGWAVSGVPTNTRGSKSYDNLVFSRATTTEYTGTWGVLDFEQEFGLTRDRALDVSDHRPVWATFKIREQAPHRIATRP